ncbi:apolipoprotein D-like [Macrosteles quadrilineatus]|uniref:apolipoprotein D-like n=1 Tax=Macrosteles quadrilineatus TaxID=74068 RepID=UPI0023E25A0F|nr:apolipoprotein D-like [Macrosteles quadrilineatus]
MRTFLLVLLSLLAGSEAWLFSWLHWGRCPEISTIPYMTYYMYLNGTWYLRSGYNIDHLPGTGRCGYSQYTYNDTSGTAEVKFRHMSSWLNRWESVNGTIAQSLPLTYGKMTLDIPNRWGFWDETMPYWVLDEVLADYSIVYSCKNFLFNFYSYSSWILTRSPIRDLADLEEELKTYNLDPNKFVKYDQTNCPPHY